MESDNEKTLNRITKELLTHFCHSCIEHLCDDALESIEKLRIAPEKTAFCYLMFLQEKILNTEIECKNRINGCKDRIFFGKINDHMRECDVKINSINKCRVHESLNTVLTKFMIFLII
jgi:uncharacterized protein YutE (UPF0331/DUF86 family)